MQLPKKTAGVSGCWIALNEDLNVLDLFYLVLGHSVIRIVGEHAAPARPPHLCEVLLHALVSLFLDELVQLLLSVK
jgi:hypothetical protein